MLLLTARAPIPSRWRHGSVSHEGGQILAVESDGTSLRVRTGAQESNSFADPRWTAIEDIDAVVGEHVRIWPKEQYTAVNLFGESGERVLAEVTARVRRAGDDVAAHIGEWTAWTIAKRPNRATPRDLSVPRWGRRDPRPRTAASARSRIVELHPGAVGALADGTPFFAPLDEMVHDPDEDRVQCISVAAGIDLSGTTICG